MNRSVLYRTVSVEKVETVEIAVQLKGELLTRLVVFYFPCCGFKVQIKFRCFMQQKNRRSLLEPLVSTWSLCF